MDLEPFTLENISFSMVHLHALTPSIVYVEVESKSSDIFMNNRCASKSFPQI